ncbi:hypothetical protein B0J14DRAFT_9095 [Halenospora varia]|nr:hypothetical protein B0J14DRAFT_9095 [Halenospora varia]
MAMAEENKGLDLERELTCSICAEILYQPLTLLDCLHTFCGVCLKEWFSYQLNISRTATPSNPPKSTPYTCPSCRAEVRDVRHDAKVTTLLEMFLAVNPTKGRTDEERGVIGAKYKPGDNVLVKVEEREKTLRERRLEDEDRRMVEAVTADIGVVMIGNNEEGGGNLREGQVGGEMKVR